MTLRIRLAEAMGLDVDFTHFTEVRVWRGKWVEFDPENNDADCMALVDWLPDNGYEITINWHRNCERHKKASVRLIGANILEYWIGDCWRTGVCKLADKVIGYDEDKVIGDDPAANPLPETRTPEKCCDHKWEDAYYDGTEVCRYCMRLRSKPAEPLPECDHEWSEMTSAGVHCMKCGKSLLPPFKTTIT